MTTKISSLDTTMQPLPGEVLLLIFQPLSLAGCFVARRVCRLWAELAKDPTTIAGACFQDKALIEKLPTLTPRYSPWEQMSSHWVLNEGKHVLRFSSVCQQGVISFFPPGSKTKQSSKFFSFTRPISFYDGYTLLAQQGETYFLKFNNAIEVPSSQTVSHPSLFGHTLKVKNLNNSRHDRTFSILKELPEDEQNMQSCPIVDCVPLSENKLAIVTQGCTVLLWDLEPQNPVCINRSAITCQINGEKWDQYTGKGLKVGNCILIGHQLINLKDWPVKSQFFNSRDYSSIQSSGSFLCGILRDTREIRLLQLSPTGDLEQKWSFDVGKATGDEFNKNILGIKIESISENYIVYSAWKTHHVFLFILNMNGELMNSREIDFIKQAIFEEVNENSIYEYPIFAQTSGHVLMFKHPEGQTLSFYHILWKKTILEFDWTKRLYEPPLYPDNASVQDICWADNKLTILSTIVERDERFTKSALFRVIQFDPLHTGS